VSTARPPRRNGFVAALDSVAGAVEGLLSWVTGRRRTGNAIEELGSWVLGPANRRRNRSE
jgi:hypothetical protein